MLITWFPRFSFQGHFLPGSCPARFHIFRFLEILAIMVSYSKRVLRSKMGGNLSSEASASSSSNLGDLKGMQDIPLDIEANSVANSGAAASPSGNVQDGVKNIEAISMTWTKWGLIAAYARYVNDVVKFESLDSNGLQYLPHGFHHITRGASCFNPLSICYEFLQRPFLDIYCFGRARGR
jgi:hypothetical protein